MKCLKCRGGLHIEKGSTQSAHLLKTTSEKNCLFSLRCLLNKYDFPCKIMRSGEKTMVYSFCFGVFILIYRMFVCVSRKAFLLSETKIIANNKRSKDRLFTYSQWQRYIFFLHTMKFFEMFHKKSFKTTLISKQSKDHKWIICHV